MYKRQEGEWLAVHRIIPTVTIKDDVLSIKSIRDFRYDSQQQPIQQHYINDTYPLNDVKRLWFGLSHFADNGLAHNLLSFEFSDGRFLAVSVEARLEQGQSYDPLLGMFNQYEMIYVIGTEQDIIGLRSHVRKEPFYLYPMSFPKEQVAKLLLLYMTQAQNVQARPQFYNTLFNNCLSHLLILSGAFNELDILTDRRLIFPGYSYEVAYELGYIDQSRSLPAIQAASLVDENVSPDEDDFSHKIRKALQVNQ